MSWDLLANQKRGDTPSLAHLPLMTPRDGDKASCRDTNPLCQCDMASIDGCTSLLDLPLEVVVLVIDCYTDDRLDKQTLCALACTCKVLQAECEKKIYQKLHIESYDDLYNILGAFAGRPERLAIVETLRILYTFRDQYRATLEARQTLYRYMTKMTALKTFHVESPYDNFDWHKGGDMWVNQDMEAFRQALEKASLHADNGRLTQNEHIGFSKLEKRRSRRTLFRR